MPATTAPLRATHCGAAHAEQLAPASISAMRPGRAGVAVRRKALPHRPAAAGDHQAPLRIGIDVDDAHLAPVGFQLVGEDAGDGGADVLAHLGADDVDGDDAVAVDACTRWWARSADLELPRAAPCAGAKPKVTAGAGHGDQEAAARKRRC